MATVERELLSADFPSPRYFKYFVGGVGVIVLALVAFPLVHAKVPWSIEELMVLSAIAVPLALMVVFAAQFKHVSLLGPCLVVSNGKREAHVPLGQIVRVTQTLRPGYRGYIPNRDVVLVLLDRPSPFGSKILFTTFAGRSFLSSEENPSVARLRRACAEQTSMVCPHHDAQK